MTRQPGRVPRIVSVTHDILGDPFWEVYNRGITDAGLALGCAVERFRPDRYTPTAMLEALGNALRDSPDALVCTIPDAMVLDAPLHAAVASGVALIATNARDPRGPDERIPYLRYVGGSDRAAGALLGKTLIARKWAGNVLCLDHYLHDQHCHMERYDGLLLALGRDNCRRLRIEGDAPDRAAAQVRDALRADPRISAIVTLGPPGADAVFATKPELPHVSFDVSDEQRDALRDGRLIATIDSQQYLQGFWGVTLAWQYLCHGLLPVDDILTGPRLMTAADVGAVQDPTEAVGA